VTAATQNASGELLQSEEYLRGHVVEGGVPISDLDEPRRMPAFRVAYQYQTLGNLSRSASDWAPRQVAPAGFGQ
jgi:hypothetical protein